LNHPQQPQGRPNEAATSSADSGVYHRKIGDIVVTTISDGYLDGTLEVMRNVDVEKARQILTDAFRPARRTSVNTFLIHSKGRIATSTPDRATICSPSRLRSAQSRSCRHRSEVDRYGVADPHAPGSLRRPDRHVERQLLFPNAELVMHENELAHWFDDGAMAKVDERSAQLYFLAGREQVAPYKSRTRLFRRVRCFPA
jgi:hypothetical protein